MNKKSQVAALIYLLYFFVSITTKLNAQTITLIPNPDGHAGVRGYLIPYNNNLYFEYQSSDYVLGQYNGINDSLISNPDAGIGYQGDPIIYNNSLYYIYSGVSRGYKLAKYDGTTVTTFNNPDSGNGFLGDAILFNNDLIYLYQADSANRIAQYDGNTISLIPNADSGAVNGNFIVYNSSLYTQYNNSYRDTLGNIHSRYQLAAYDGSILRLISNPDSGPGYLTAPIPPIIFQNNLYINYDKSFNISQLAKYDGTSLSLIPNPDGGGGYSAEPIVYNGYLYFSYKNASGKYQLAKFDGTTITLIPNPDLGNGFVGYAKILYNGNLYFQYQNNSYNYQLAKFDGTSIALIPNPDPGKGYKDIRIIYGNNLYFEYENASFIYQLAQSNGDSIHLFANPDGGFGVLSSPMVYNGSLYFAYYNASNITQLEKFTDNALPLTLLSFSATDTKENRVDLNWQTSTEINTDYFELQHGADAAHFNNVIKIAAAGNSAFTENYKYVDSLISLQSNIPPVLYYRLKMVDKDGRFTYSNIITVKTMTPSALISATPNPVQNILSITYTSQDEEELSLKVFDMNGKAVIVKTAIAVKGVNKYQLPFTNMSSATYLLQIKGKNGVNTIKIIK